MYVVGFATSIGFSPRFFYYYLIFVLYFIRSILHSLIISKVFFFILLLDVCVVVVVGVVVDSLKYVLSLRTIAAEFQFFCFSLHILFVCYIC